MSEVESEFMTGREIAEMFRVSNSTVNLWKRSGMPFYGKSSCARFLKADVMDWQKTQSAIYNKKAKKETSESVVES